MVLYELAVDAPLTTTLTYSQPVGRIEPLPTGCCVRVPLGRRLVIGYVLGPAETPAASADFAVKPIAEVIGAHPRFPPSLLPFYRWVANYYLYPLGEVLRTALPLHPTSRRQHQVQAKEQSVVVPGPRLLSVLAATSTEDQGNDEPWAEVWAAEGLNPAAVKAMRLFCTLYREGGQVPVPRPQLVRHYANVRPQLVRLQEKGLLQITRARVYRDPFGQVEALPPAPPQLTQEQQSVLDVLLPAVAAGQYAPFLLFGVTGCGKTEVYLQAVAHALARGKTALVLVPEIALASQLEAHFHARFGGQLAVLHSGLGEGERFDQWDAVRTGQARVVLGARSAVFAPLEHLGIVIVDEEHEPAYKQEDGLKYNGRDLAVLRARMGDCPVVLGSATPSVVSYHHAANGKYTLLTMQKRVAQQPMPTVEIIDLANTARSRPDLMLSDDLIHELHATMDRGEQSLLFINRRGFSPFMLCRDCGTILQCRHCQVSLTLHRARGLLLCHYCGYSQHPSAVCPSCHSHRVAGFGIGAERIEEEVRQLLPHARIARLDSDTSANRQHYLTTLKAMRDHKIDILIGTQMIAKGLHFPQITLVGVVWADASLGMPDYKASERTFALLAQVTGRAGRGDRPGRVLIQTYQPHQYSIELAKRHQYTAFYQREVTVRQPLLYPPFARLVNLRLSGKDEQRVEQAARAIADFLRQHPLAHQAAIVGPSPAPLVRLKDRIRWQLLLKSSGAAVLHELCGAVLAEKGKLWPASVAVDFDVDPENML